MDIPKVGAFAASVNMQAHTAEKEEKVEAPEDQFSQGEEPRAAKTESAAMINAASVLNVKSLDKRGMEYRVRSFATSDEGITYVSYTSTRPPKDKDEPQNCGYISALSPRGEILWEAPVNEEGLSDIKIGPDGTIFATTKEHLKALKSDGTLAFEHKFEEPVKGHWMDSSGNHYFVTDSTREFYTVDENGVKIELPEGLKGVKGSEVVQSSPDELYSRDGNHFVKVDLKEGKKIVEFTYKDPVEQKANFSRVIDRFEVDDKGMIRLWMRNNTFVASSPPIDDLHCGLGFGFGHRWGMHPHLPPDDHYYSTTTICDMSVEKLGKDGEILSAVGNLGSDPKQALLSDGSIIFSNNSAEYIDNPAYNPNGGSTSYTPRTIASGKYRVGRIAPGGMKNDEFLKVEGSIKKIVPDPERGSFYVCHGDSTVSEFNPKGELLRSQTMPKGEKSLEPAGLGGRDSFLFKENWGVSLWALDLESGKAIPLTDNDMDYSFKVAAKEIEQDESLKRDECGEGIEKFNEWINVSGVKIRKNVNIH